MIIDLSFNLFIYQFHIIHQKPSNNNIDNLAGLLIL